MHSSTSARWERERTSSSRRWTACGPAEWRCTPPSTYVSSNEQTVEEGGTVFYRHRDVEELVTRRRRLGHAIDVDYTEGTTPDDLHVDVPPYSDVHLRTELSGYVTTSLALVVTKGARRPSRLRTLMGRPAARLDAAALAQLPAGVPCCNRCPLSRLWIPLVLS